MKVMAFRGTVKEFRKFLYIQKLALLATKKALQPASK